MHKLLFRSTGMMLMGTWEEARRNRAILEMSSRAEPAFALDTAISSKVFVGKMRSQTCYKQTFKGGMGHLHTVTYFLKKNNKIKYNFFGYFLSKYCFLIA